MADGNLIEQLEGMEKVGYKVTTVADLVGKLAGLPPMMEVYVDSESTGMFLNDVQLQQANGFPTFLRLICARKPRPAGPPRTYDEELAMQRQAAMQMGANSAKATEMHEVVE